VHRSRGRSRSSPACEVGIGAPNGFRKLENKKTTKTKEASDHHVQIPLQTNPNKGNVILVAFSAGMKGVKGAYLRAGAGEEVRREEERAILSAIWAENEQRHTTLRTGRNQAATNNWPQGPQASCPAWLRRRWMETARLGTWEKASCTMYKDQTPSCTLGAPFCKPKS
jgi:hypothetical protein